MSNFENYLETMLKNYNEDIIQHSEILEKQGIEDISMFLQYCSTRKTLETSETCHRIEETLLGIKKLLQRI